jgi:linoleoyl-CoA desaturase
VSTTVAAPTKRLVKFAPKGQESFYDAIKHKVDEYFQTHNIEQQANTKMKIKTVVMLSLYFVPYFVMVSGAGAIHPVVFYALWVMMGMGIVGIGASVMHDSNHGSYSKNGMVNSFLGNVLNVIGGYAPNWRIQHNILHHTYTNLHGLDEDIAGTILIRMHPESPKLKIHKYQHIYSWGLYSLMNLMWVLVKDYKLIFRYDKQGLLRKEKLTKQKALTELSLLKVFYFGYIIALPILFSGMAWYHVVLGFIAMHMVAGLSLACIFQPAHVMESSEYPSPSEDLKMENNWAVHQLLNTTNFAPGSTVTSWFIGGLNYQIEHHLFPQVCHVHYPALSNIVKTEAEKYGLPYNVQPTVWSALVEHGKMLKILGRQA